MLHAFYAAFREIRYLTDRYLHHVGADPASVLGGGPSPLLHGSPALSILCPCRIGESFLNANQPSFVIRITRGPGDCRASGTDCRRFLRTRRWPRDVSAPAGKGSDLVSIDVSRPEGDEVTCRSPLWHFFLVMVSG